MKIHCQYSKLVPINELKGHPKNRNIHPQDQIIRLAKIIEYQGIRHPIKVSNRSGYITSGHGRLLVAQYLGLKEFPVSYQDYDSEEMEYLDVQADNAIASWAELDMSGINNDLSEIGPFDIDLLGFKNFKVDMAEKDAIEDEIPQKVEANTKLGDLYKLGNHRLLCGDSTVAEQVERLMDGQKADMVFTDPPYGVDAVGGDKAVGGGKIVKSNTYERIIGDLSKDVARQSIPINLSLAPVQVIFGGHHFCHSLPESSGWLFWFKNQTGDFAPGELAWTNSKKQMRYFSHQWAGLIKGLEHKEKRCHPTQKPIALAEWCFDEYSPVGKSVVDLFGGSGSTLIACEKTKRKCFMMELDPYYCDVIVARWEKYTGLKAELIESDTVKEQ